MANNFSKLSCTDLQALISAEICHIEARSTLSHDNPHFINIREAVEALTRLALLGKFNALSHGRGLPGFIEESEMRR